MLILEIILFGLIGQFVPTHDICYLFMVIQSIFDIYEN